MGCGFGFIDCNICVHIEKNAEEWISLTAKAQIDELDNPRNRRSSDNLTAFWYELFTGSAPSRSTHSTEDSMNHSLCEIHQVTVRTRYTHHRKLRQLGDLIKIFLIREDRSTIGLIGGNNDSALVRNCENCVRHVCIIPPFGMSVCVYSKRSRFAGMSSNLDRNDARSDCSHRLFVRIRRSHGDFERRQTKVLETKSITRNHD